MDTLKKITGSNFYFPPLLTFVEQPKIKDIATLGENFFFRGQEFFKVSDREFFIKESIKKIEDPLEKKKKEEELSFSFQSDLDVFNFITKDRSSQLIVESLLVLIFPSFRGCNWQEISPTRIVFNIKLQQDELAIQEYLTEDMSKEEEEKIRSKYSIKNFIVDNEIFKGLKELIDYLFSYETEEGKDSKLKPLGTMAEKIAEKMEKAKQKRARLYGEEKRDKDTSVIGSMVSILSTASRIAISEINEMTFPQLVIQFDRAKKLISYQTQISLGAFGGLDADSIINWEFQI